MRRLTGYLAAATSTSHAQTAAGFVAAALSLVGTVFGFMSATLIPQTGDLLMLVRERRTAEPVTDAIVEVLTPADALVTMFATLERNGVRRSLKEGMYRVRVTNARFAPETRVVQVLAGQTSEVRLVLSPRPPAAPIAAPIAPAAVAPPSAAVTSAATKPAAATRRAAAPKPDTSTPTQGAVRTVGRTRAAADTPRPHTREAP